MMFDWFKKREYSNVDPFPEPKAVPHIEPPAPKEKEPVIHYKIGHTDDNRISFIMGHTTLTMNKQGCENLIAQLELYKDQLSKEEEE